MKPTSVEDIMKYIPKTYLLFCLLFLSNGCQTETTPPEEMRPQFVGTWELYYTDSPDSGSLNNAVRLTLNEDLTFSSTSSFFWSTDDSLKTRALFGKWDVFEEYIERANYPMISFTVGTEIKTWWLMGQPSKGYMHFFNNKPSCSWKSIK